MREQRKVRALWEEFPQQTDGVFIGAPLPGGISISKVKGDMMERGGHFLILSEFRAPIRGNALYFMGRDLSKQLSHCIPDCGRRKIRRLGGKGEPGPAVYKGEQASTAPFPDHGVSLKMSDLLTLVGTCGPVMYGVFLPVLPLTLRFPTLPCPLSLAAQMIGEAFLSSYTGLPSKQSCVDGAVYGSAADPQRRLFQPEPFFDLLR